MTQKLTEIKGEIVRFTIIVVDFNKHFLLINRSKQKSAKIWNNYYSHQYHLNDLYNTLYIEFMHPARNISICFSQEASATVNHLVLLIEVYLIVACFLSL